MVRRFIPGDKVNRTFLKTVIDNQAVAEATETKKVRGSLYASDYGQCQRKVWFQFFPQDFPPDEDHSPRTYRIFANGNDVHVRLSRYLNKQTELEFVEEVNVPRDELDVHGRCDGICTVHNTATVVEFKSINAKDVDRPKEEHLGQIMWYLHMFMHLRKQVKEDFGFKEDDVVLESAVISETALSGRTFQDLNHVEKWLMLSHQQLQGEVIYESKQTQEIYAFPVEYDEEKAKGIKAWFEQVKHYVDRKEMPPIRHLPTKYPCSWGFKESAGKCSYYNRCWGSSDISAPIQEHKEAVLLLKINGLKSP